MNLNNFYKRTVLDSQFMVFFVFQWRLTVIDTYKAFQDEKFLGFCSVYVLKYRHIELINFLNP